MSEIVLQILSAEHIDMMEVSGRLPEDITLHNIGEFVLLGCAMHSRSFQHLYTSLYHE